MSEYLADSPVVARTWCPGCDPFADPTLEILDIRYCDTHTPARTGEADTAVATEGYVSGSTEAGGESNRLWCQLLHRDAPRVAAPRRSRGYRPFVPRSG
ncbi:MAG: hypothetical protein HYU41_24440 [Candidatus Rokubacteria bacterium]|nr:hypothetical protein [Candidatus Rokubacteria bacterium]